MSVYIFDGIKKECGTIYLTIRNDQGESVVNVAGDYLLSELVVTNAVEENGIGGVPRTSDLEFEVYDRGNLFQDTILNKDTVASAQITVEVDVDGTRTRHFHGIITFPIEYSSYYDDEAGNEVHSCKFSAYSIFQSLEGVSIQDLVTYLQPYQIDPPSPANFLFVALERIIRGIMGLLPLAASEQGSFVVESDIVFDDGDGYSTAMGDVCYMFKNQFTGLYKTLWLETYPGNYVSLGNCKALLEKMAGDLLCYPIFRWNYTTEKYDIVFKQRGCGDAYTEELQLKESYKKDFFGYDAIRVRCSNTDYPDRRVYPTDISDDAFEVLGQKFDYTSGVAIIDPEDEDLNYDRAYIWIKDINDNVYRVQNVSSATLGGGTFEDSYNYFLRFAFVKYWMYRNPNVSMNHSPQKLYADYYERKYVGVSNFDVDTVEELDEIEINENSHTVIEAVKDLTKNELTLKMVQYI